MPHLLTNLLALFALRAATSCALGAPRARDVGGRYYGTVVRARGRWSPGALRGETDTPSMEMFIDGGETSLSDIDGQMEYGLLLLDTLS